jgi:hypothetical protein
MRRWDEEEKMAEWEVYEEDGPEFTGIELQVCLWWNCGMDETENYTARILLLHLLGIEVLDKKNRRYYSDIDYQDLPEKIRKKIMRNVNKSLLDPRTWCT